MAIEKIFASGLMLAMFGLAAMVITGLAGFYPSILYYSFGFVMLGGFGVIFLAGMAKIVHYIFTGKMD